MGATTRGKLVRRIKAKDLKGVLAIPVEMRSAFKDGYDGQFVVETGRHRRRVCLAISSGGELVVPDWLRQSILADTSPNDDVSIYLSTRRIWLLAREQAEAIAEIVTRYGRPASRTGKPAFTSPVQLSPRLPNLDRVNEVLAIVEGEQHK
jgi:hypothetical protein